MSKSYGEIADRAWENWHGDHATRLSVYEFVSEAVLREFIRRVREGAREIILWAA